MAIRDNTLERKDHSGNAVRIWPIRLMVGLLMLKHLRNVSDEQVVAQFTENAYYQYFCGMEAFSIAAPCAASELVHFRHRIGEEGLELILKESIRINLVIEDNLKSEDNKELIDLVNFRIKEGLMSSGAEPIAEEKSYDVIRHTALGKSIVRKGTPISSTIESDVVIDDKVMIKAKV